MSIELEPWEIEGKPEVKLADWKSEKAVDLAKPVLAFNPKRNAHGHIALNAVDRHAQKVAFFHALIKHHGQIKKACKAVGWASPVTFYNECDRDPEFKKAVEKFSENIAMMIEDALLEEGVEGIMEAVYYQGKIVGYQRERNMGALTLLAKGFMPDKYNDRKPKDDTSVNVNVKVGVAFLPRPMSEKDFDLKAAALLKNQDTIDAEFEPVKIEDKRPTKVEVTG